MMSHNQNGMSRSNNQPVRRKEQMVEVTAKAPKVEKEATVMVDLGENVQDAIDRFGADVVFSNYIANVKIGV